MLHIIRHLGTGGLVYVLQCRQTLNEIEDYIQEESLFKSDIFNEYLFYCYNVTGGNRSWKMGSSPATLVTLPKAIAEKLVRTYNFRIQIQLDISESYGVLLKQIPEEIRKRKTAVELSAEEKEEIEKYLISPFEFDIIPLDRI